MTDVALPPSAATTSFDLHVLHDQPRLPFPTGTALWFIVSPITFFLLSMATCMPIRFSSGRYPIR